MSYTMTLDMPGKATAYVERRGSRFQSQLRSLVIAFVTTEMQREGYEWSGDYSDTISRRVLLWCQSGRGCGLVSTLTYANVVIHLAEFLFRVVAKDLKSNSDN